MENNEGTIRYINSILTKNRRTVYSVQQFKRLKYLKHVNQDKHNVIFLNDLEGSLNRM